MRNVAYFLFFLCLFLKNPKSLFKRFSYQGKRNKTLTLLANGPSLKELLPRILVDDEFQNTDFIVLNFFAFDEIFNKLKPQHYCLVDPMYFRDTHKIQDVRKLFRILNDVSWNMNIYIPASYEKSFIHFSRLNNPFIHIVPVNCTPYLGDGKIGLKLYKYNLAMNTIGTVANYAIYVGINNGYCMIKLYGVDHTFFTGLTVNKKNELCRIERHFYDDEQELKPILRNADNKVFKISDFLKETTRCFVAHDQLAKYATYVGAEIINCTQCSLIDSYYRK